MNTKKIIIIGDSNVCLHTFKTEVVASKFLDCEVSLVRPTILTTYKDTLDEIANGTDAIIISHLLNQVQIWKTDGMAKI